MATDRSRGVVALLAVVAVILAAVAVGPLFAVDQGGQRAPGIETPQTNATGTEPSPLAFPLEPIMAAIVVVGLFAVVVQFVSDPWETFVRFVGMTVGVLAFVAGAWLLLVLDAILSGGSPAESAAPNGTPTPSTTPSGTPGYGEGAASPLALPVDSAAAIVIVAAAIAVIAVFAWRSETLQSVLSTAEERESGTVDHGLASVAEVASETADRVEAAETPRAADNAIYRAWTEMVELLGVGDPQEATPRQFEATAVESGLNPEDVHALTVVFEEVRYGDATLTVSPSLPGAVLLVVAATALALSVRD